MRNKQIVQGLLLLLFITVAAFTSNAQIEYPEDKVSWKFTVEQDGDVAYIVGTITMVEHWHIYAANLPEGGFSIPSNISLTKSANFRTVGKIIEPKPIFVHDDLADEDLYYHSNTIKLKQKIKILSEEDFTITGEFSFQTCDDTHCLPPHSAEFTVKVKGAKKEEVSEDMFANLKGDEFTDKDGVNYVKVNDKWYEVPEGNSIAFYKKYLILGGKHEE